MDLQRALVIPRLYTRTISESNLGFEHGDRPFERRSGPNPTVPMSSNQVTHLGPVSGGSTNIFPFQGGDTNIFPFNGGGQLSRMLSQQAIFPLGIAQPSKSSSSPKSSNRSKSPPSPNSKTCAAQPGLSKLPLGGSDITVRVSSEFYKRGITSRLETHSDIINLLGRIQNLELRLSEYCETYSLFPGCRIRISITTPPRSKRIAQDVECYLRNSNSPKGVHRIFTVDHTTSGSEL